MGDGRDNSSNLGWEGIAVDGVFAPRPIVEAVVQMYLVELVAVAERTARNIDWMTSVVIDREHHAVAGVGEDTADPVLVQMQGPQVRVEQQPRGFKVHR